MLTDYDVVVDAAGPFHSYGSGAYRLPRAAIAAGVHYLDLSDNSDFCAGISELDQSAKAAGLCVLSGVSSVPALSSAAVHALAEADPVCVIDTAILPGNRAPRGMSVMHSILAQAGRPFWRWRGNRWERCHGWSDPATYRLPRGISRQGWQIDVPDFRLFPGHFGAGTVIFRAGLELGVMRYGLAIFAFIRRILPFPVNRPMVRFFKLVADLLAPFGSRRGGMSVQVSTGTEKRTWSLPAEHGDGPSIPAVPIRTSLRQAPQPAATHDRMTRRQINVPFPGNPARRPVVWLYPGRWLHRWLAARGLRRHPRPDQHLSRAACCSGVGMIGGDYRTAKSHAGGERGVPCAGSTASQTAKPAELATARNDMHRPQRAAAQKWLWETPLLRPSYRQAFQVGNADLDWCGL